MYAELNAVCGNFWVHVCGISYKKLRTSKLGLTKHGDTSNSGKDDLGIRHAWIQSHGWSPMVGEDKEIANLLCHLVWYTSWLFGSAGSNWIVEPLF